MMEKLLTCREVAELLRISPTTAKIWASKRKFPVIKVGRLVRVAPEALEAWVRENTHHSLHRARTRRLRAEKRPKGSRFEDVLQELCSEGDGRGRK